VASVRPLQFQRKNMANFVFSFESLAAIIMQPLQVIGILLSFYFSFVLFLILELKFKSRTAPVYAHQKMKT
jgi:hypothetical protein